MHKYVHKDVVHMVEFRLNQFSTGAALDGLADRKNEYASDLERYQRCIDAINPAFAIFCVLAAILLLTYHLL